MKTYNRVLWGCAVWGAFAVAGCLPSGKCQNQADCPAPQTCNEGWCETFGSRFTLGGDGNASSGTSSSSGGVACVDVAVPQLQPNCLGNLDVVDMVGPCIRLTFAASDFPAVGMPSCPQLGGGRVGGFELHGNLARNVTATVSGGGNAGVGLRFEQDPAGCGTAGCSQTTAMFNTGEHTNIWVETGVGVLGGNVLLVIQDNSF